MSGLVYYPVRRGAAQEAEGLNPLYVGSRLLHSMADLLTGLTRLNPLYVGSRLLPQAHIYFVRNNGS